MNTKLTTALRAAGFRFTTHEASGACDASIEITNADVSIQITEDGSFIVGVWDETELAMEYFPVRADVAVVVADVRKAVRS